LVFLSTVSLHQLVQGSNPFPFHEKSYFSLERAVEEGGEEVVEPAAEGGLLGVHPLSLSEVGR
jgi:hypothetical protein